MEYTAEELKVMLEKMQKASDAFYRMAISIGNHPFIEFCGLMNEYIKMCEQAHAKGIDFTACSIHTGSALPMQHYNAKYLAEKISCIYGATLQTDEVAREAFLGELGLSSKSLLGTPEENAGLDC